MTKDEFIALIEQMTAEELKELIALIQEKLNIKV